MRPIVPISFLRSKGLNLWNQAGFVEPGWTNCISSFHRSGHGKPAPSWLHQFSVRGGAPWLSGRRLWILCQSTGLEVEGRIARHFRKRWQLLPQTITGPQISSRMFPQIRQWLLFSQPLNVFWCIGPHPRTASGWRRRSGTPRGRRDFAPSPPATTGARMASSSPLQLGPQSRSPLYGAKSVFRCGYLDPQATQVRREFTQAKIWGNKRFFLGSQV